MKSIQIRPTTAAAALEDYVLPYRSWIERTLGTAYSNTVTLETHNALADVAAQQLVAGVRVYQGAHAGWLDVCEGWEMPPDASPRISVSRFREQVAGSEPASAWAVAWDGCPIAVRLKGLATPIIVLKVPAAFPGERYAPNPKNWLIVRREQVCAVLRVLEFAAVHSGRKYLHGASEIIPLSGNYDWDSLVLDATLTRLVRRDLENVLWPRKMVSPAPASVPPRIFVLWAARKWQDKRDSRDGSPPTNRGLQHRPARRKCRGQ